MAMKGRHERMSSVQFFQRSREKRRSLSLLTYFRKGLQAHLEGLERSFPITSSQVEGGLLPMYSLETWKS